MLYKVYVKVYHCIWTRHIFINYYYYVAWSVCIWIYVYLCSNISVLHLWRIFSWGLWTALNLAMDRTCLHVPWKWRFVQKSLILFDPPLKHFYRPQTRFAKVMFLHLSVSHSVHGRGCLPQCMLGYTPPPLRADTPPGNKWAVRILLECILVL